MHRPILCAAVVVACGSVVVAHATGRPSPRLTVTPARVRIDQPFDVRLAGLPAGQTITLYCHYADALGLDTQSHATYRANAAGTVDLATQAPTAGAYRGVDPMGLIWSAPVTTADAVSVALIGYVHPGVVTFTAKIGQRVVAQATAQRSLLSAAVGHRSLRAKGLYGEFYWPAGKTHVPAVLVVGGSEGGLDAYLWREAALLASHGYAALALAYFGEAGLPDQLANIPLEYFMRALDWLQTQPAVDRNRLAVIGTSRGGELALLLAAHDRRLKAAIAYSGSGLVFASVHDPRVPAWTWRGKPVAWVRKNAPWQGAAIPVQQINGPFLLVAGRDDHIWNSSFLEQFALTWTHTHHHPFRDQMLTYAGAGHLIQPPYLATDATIDSRVGGDMRDQEHADADSWTHLLRLLASRFSS